VQVGWIHHTCPARIASTTPDGVQPPVDPDSWFQYPPGTTTGATEQRAGPQEGQGQLERVTAADHITPNPVSTESTPASTQPRVLCQG